MMMMMLNCDDKRNVCVISSILLIFLIVMIQCVNCSRPSAQEIREAFGKDRNRDDEKFNRYPSGIEGSDLRRETYHIVRAHEVLRVALREFLNWRDTNLTDYLKEMRSQNESFYDEFGIVIKSYRKVFSFILDQVEEVQLGNYAIKQFEKDRHDLCSVARYLSHQVRYDDRKTIIQRMGEALERPCDPCTAYKRQQHAENVVSNTVEEHKCLYDNGAINSSNLQSENATNSPLANTIVTTTTTTTEASVINDNNNVTESTLIVTPTSSSNNNKKPGHQHSSMNNDLKPCTYRPQKVRQEIGGLLSSSVEVNCENLSVLQVFVAFMKSPITNREIETFTFNIKRPSSTSHFDVELPEDLVDDHRIRSIRLYCPENDNNKSSATETAERIPLKISENAFRYSQNYTRELVVRGCDLSHLDFSFLNGFDQLKTLSIDRVTNVDKSFVTLPPLKSLNRLSLRACSTARHLLDNEGDVSSVNDVWNKFPPPLVHGITELCLSYHDDLDDSILSRILDWILISSSDTLLEFDIFHNKKMTTIPPQVKKFKRLVYFSASHNGLPLNLPMDSLRFGGFVEKIHLTSSQIGNILPGTFKGDFSRTEMIDLSNNKLTRFEEITFLPLLQQLNQNKGKLRLDRNPIDCETDPCHLAWLIRDRRELLMDNIINAKCSYNGTSFQSIDITEDRFTHCPET